MNKEELNEKALQYALGTLPQEEIDDFESRLKNDRALQGAVLDWQRVNEEDAYDCDQLEVPFQVYSRVMSEIDESRARSSKSSNSLARVSFLTWGGWAAAAGVALMFGALSLNDADDSRSTYLASTAPVSDITVKTLGNPNSETTKQFDIDQDEFQDRLMELTGLAESYWFSREGLPPETEDGAEAKSFSGGFTIYDRKIKIGVIGIENIPESRLGTYYTVWAKSSDLSKPVWAGRLKAGETGSQLAFFDLSSNEAIKDLDEGVSFFVTEEKEQKPEQPEGRIVLSGI